MSLVLRKALSILTSILIALLLVLAVLLVGVRLVGFKPYTVLSGSMEPTYHVGAIIYVKEVDPDTLKVDDPVTFYLNSSRTVATHRIIEILPDGRLVTQGDANDTADDPISKSQVIGKPIFQISYLGYLSNFLQNQPGRSIAAVSCVFLITVAVIPDLVFSKKKYEGEAEVESETKEENEL